MKFLKGLEPLALLALRIVLAIIFVYHGYPKLAHPTPALHDAFVSHGLPAYFVSIAGILECFGALLFVLGIFTRAAGLLLTIEMAVAIWKVHSLHGIMSVKDYEFPLALAAGCFVLASTGAGLLSIDNLLFGDSSPKRRSTKSTKD
jgi:putative oxidoreductase